MIESHEIGSPAAKDAYDVPVEQQIDWPSRYMGSTLEEISGTLKRIEKNPERAREKAPPTVINLSPGQLVASYPTKTKLRVENIVLTGASGDQIALRIGTFSYNFWSNGAFSIPFPIEVDAGVDLSAVDITNPGAVAWSLYVIAYAE
jgi:hypothetical protein